MSDKLKDFIQNNKAEWDELQPTHQGWDDLQHKLKSRKTFLLKIEIRQLMAAAAIVAVVFSSLALYFSLKQKNTAPAIVQKVDSTTKEPTLSANDVADTQTIEPFETKEKEQPANNKPVQNGIPQYVKIIEERQSQMNLLRKENPDLYRRFTEDLEKLEVSYDALKDKSKISGNKEIIIQAMLQNLQFQAELLNKQLEVLQHIKENKNKKQNENNTSL